MRLANHTQALYELRFSPMCKPAGEVAYATKLESHTTRSRVMMMWRIAKNIITWQKREVELMYQSTLDSISEAFDVFHYPVSQYMLDARADIWDAGLAPECVMDAIEGNVFAAEMIPEGTDTLLLAGEIAQLGDSALLAPMEAALKKVGVTARAWLAPTGAHAYALGAREAATLMAQNVVSQIKNAGVKTVIADGPETAWALTKIYPALGVELPDSISVKLLSSVLADAEHAASPNGETVFVHDSRPACLLADQMATNLAVLPGYRENEDAFGLGEVYDAPRRLIDALGHERVFSTWTRSLSKSSGADDGLWLTYPDLASKLAEQRLAYAGKFGATTIVSDSPLAVSFLGRHAGPHGVKVKLLAELVG